MNIAIVGAGYVGLVAAACFAETGNIVWCVDQNVTKIQNLQAGIMPIYEPGLQELVDKNKREGRLHFSSDLEPALEKALVCFLAVGTPPGADGSSDLTEVYSVAGEIGRLLDHGLIVVNKSTVPVGTADAVRRIIGEKLAERGKDRLKCDVVSNPEFLKEGAALDDFLRPDRVVVGTDNDSAAEVMRQLYEPFLRNQHPLLIMDIKSAEMTKYAANAMLATRISFINEIARLCDKVGADILSVRQGVGTDSRIGMQFLYAGAGYGGSCFPKDVQQLIHMGGKNGLEMEIVKAVERVNEKQKYYLVEMISRYFGNNLSNKKFAVWGLAFKPQTDDMREAPAAVIINALVRAGASVRAFDPEAVRQAREVLAGCAQSVHYVEHMMEALNDADALILITEWRQFRQPDFQEMKRRMRQPLIFDGRNQYDPNRLSDLGFEYYCIGRGHHV